MTLELIDHTNYGYKRPVVKGTRTRVASIVAIYRMIEKESPAERIQHSLPHLSVPQIEAALEYWKQYPEEIESELRENEAVYKEHAR